MSLLTRLLGRCPVSRSGAERQPSEISRSVVPEQPPSPEAKRRKLERIRSLLRHDMDYEESDGSFNFLTDELRRRFNIVDTENVSAHGYDPIALKIIEESADGLVLDCGAGKRTTYYGNVVNFEICAYDSTDVLGVGECLPFRDEVLDAVLSLNVLEHVEDPFACAREIVRVMKPGTVLYCVVPFLQALHGYPHHYYNITHQGLRNLFRGTLLIERQEVLLSGLPIFSLTHILARWASGLQGPTREAFLNMRVCDLMGDPMQYLSLPFVRELPSEINFELASTTALIGRKPAATR